MGQTVFIINAVFSHSYQTCSKHYTADTHLRGSPSSLFRIPYFPLECDKLFRFGRYKISPFLIENIKFKYLKNNMKMILVLAMLQSFISGGFRRGNLQFLVPEPDRTTWS